mmetsp:Transcript_9482/g.10634  ORF Transcript_9482/g.10634 Transcript_9482/m.10634 type:complete len:109 (+) Transcript_9482:73-399(+)
MDLLFGMMLPSGNDAGFLLAEHFGALVKRAGDARVEPKTKSKSESDNSCNENNTEDSESAKVKELADDDMAIDECERSKYLHRYSQFRYTFVKYFIMEMNYYAQEDFK